MALPNTLMIGVQKSGTTSLFDVLGEHPDIYAPFQVKDLPFFTNDQFYQKGAEFYDRVFDRWNGEAIIAGSDVNIAHFAASSAERIYRLRPQMKLIMTVRNPVDRAFSGYKYACQRGLEQCSFDQAIDEELTGKRKYATYYQQAQLDYTRHGLYYQQIATFLRYFPRDQIYIAFFEDYKVDKQLFMKELLQFLNVDVNLSFTPIHNQTKGGYRFRWLTEFLYKEKARNHTSVQGPLEMLPVALRMKVRRKAFRALANLNKKPAHFPPMSVRTRERLKDYFSEDIQQLQKIVDKDLEALWLKEQEDQKAV